MEFVFVFVGFLVLTTIAILHAKSEEKFERELIEKRKEWERKRDNEAKDKLNEEEV